ncbi:glycosyltransferase family 2 protein [Microbispora cellulosiformans]|uniref:Glycosyltransferase family 2 protein n=1 Tax=Microbispora cellulosiformans TaxID=2614688 RepID=A0A5J5KAY5_9ACTN|nr:glycosyltransferase family 2 protein [Microbispora cellulosiformans]KAA9381892.1 glycosyltransferase family 2 protein [Microbispora cellulosiformans]
MDTESDRRVGRGAHGRIDVSVVVPAYNCRASVDRCLTSLLVQRVAKEIVVVDGGSRDGTRELLDLYAACHPRLITVIHDPHPCTPGGARNRGLARATGRYVFFCDAGDRLAPDALAPLVAAADRNGSDVVVGRVSGARDGLRDSADRASLAAVYDDLTCFKLFRRAFLERHALRFDETQRTGEDMTFTVHAYCHARVVSVVADHDCYQAEAVGEAPGAESVVPGCAADPLTRLRLVRTPIEVMARHVPPGALRDRLLLRHLRRDVLARLGAPFLAADEADREKIAVEVADICGQWLTPGVRAALDDMDAARLAALDDTARLVRLARVEAAPLRHRLTAVTWHGDHLLVGGHACLAEPAAPAVSGTAPPAPALIAPSPGGLGGVVGLVLRERLSGEERALPARHAAGSFTIVVDVTALPPGVWDVHVFVECEGVRRPARFGSSRDPGVGVPGPRLVNGVAVAPFLTRSQGTLSHGALSLGHLSIDAGGHAVRVPAAARLTRARRRAGRLLIEGRVRVGEEPAAPAVRHLVWRERGSGREHRERAAAVSPEGFAAETDVPRPGTWDAYLELDLGGPPVRLPVKVAAMDAPARTMRWWQGPLRWTARPYATAVNRRLSLSVRVDTPLTTVRRVLRALHRR